MTGPDAAAAARDGSRLVVGTVATRPAACWPTRPARSRTASTPRRSGMDLVGLQMALLRPLAAGCRGACPRAGPSRSGCSSWAKIAGARRKPGRWHAPWRPTTTCVPTGRRTVAAGDGRLDVAAPAADEAADSFLADPSDPVPTVGGNLCCWQIVNEPGSFDQRGVEDRQDVLVYSTAPLDAPTSRSRAPSRCGSSCPRRRPTSTSRRSSWTCGLTVERSTSPRASGACGTGTALDHAQLLPAGEVAEIEVDLIATANLFRAGHQVRLEVAASNWPQVRRQPPDGCRSPTPGSAPGSRATPSTTMPAHPSRLILPVVPRT